MTPTARTAPATGHDRFDELKREERAAIDQAEEARKNALAVDRAGYRLKMEEAQARPLAGWQDILGDDFSLLGLVWPDCPARHRHGPDPVALKAPWLIKPDGLYRRFWKVVQPLPVPDDQLLVHGDSRGSVLRDQPFDYRISSPCWPVWRPGSGKGWQWAVRNGKGWKTVEVDLFTPAPAGAVIRPDQASPADLIAQLTAAGVTFNPEPATWKNIGSYTGHVEQRTHTARQLFLELLDTHIGRQAPQR